MYQQRSRHGEVVSRGVAVQDFIEYPEVAYRECSEQAEKVWAKYGEERLVNRARTGGGDGTGLPPEALGDITFTQSLGSA
jgi:hypothetical protein